MFDYKSRTLAEKYNKCDKDFDKINPLFCFLQNKSVIKHSKGNFSLHLSNNFVCTLLVNLDKLCS